MNATTDPAQALLDLYCRELKLPGLRKAAPAVAREAADQNQSYTAFLATCLAQELASRREHRLAHRFAQARFPAPQEKVRGARPWDNRWQHPDEGR